MAKPTNPELLARFPSNVTVPETHEVWELTTKMIVPQGTDLEQLLADIANCKVPLPVPPETLTFVYTDLTKVS